MYEDTIFPDRITAGKRLAAALAHHQGKHGIVLAIPRGGVPVAAEVAKALDMPLDILLSKKIGHPENSEFAIGAVTLEDIILTPGHPVPAGYIAEETARLRNSIAQRQRTFLGKRMPLPLEGRIVIIVDDGIATGQTLRVSLPMIRRHHPARIVIAVPVAPSKTIRALRPEVDELIVLHTPATFTGVGAFYGDFSQVEDEEVVRLLNRWGRS